MAFSDNTGHKDAPVEEDVPVVLGGQRPHRLEKVALCVIALLGGRVCLCGLAEAREAPREELRTVHDVVMRRRGGGDGIEE